MHKNTAGFGLHQEAVQKILQSGNLYTALGLTYLASTADVEKSYSYLVNRVHIESNLKDPDTQTALKVLKEAHKVLKDPYKRKRYDFLLQVIPADDIIEPQIHFVHVDLGTTPMFGKFNRLCFAFFRAFFKGVFCVVFFPRLIIKNIPVIPRIKVHRYLSNIGPYLIILTMIMLYRYTSPDDACDDYYKILDVPRRSNTSEIKQAYRNLAKKLHPDKKAFNQDTERFQKVVDAYKVLSNYKKRKEYDFECEDGFRKAAMKNESSANLTDGFEKYGLYSFCAGPHWCVNMYYFLQ